MGLFGTKAPKTQAPVKRIFVYTVDTIPDRKYKLLGLTRAGVGKALSGNPEKAIQALVNHAMSIGADAVLGFRISMSISASGVTEMVAYGTAVKYLDEDDSEEIGEEYDVEQSDE